MTAEQKKAAVAPCQSGETTGEAGLTSKIKKPDFSKVTIEPLFEDMVDFETFSKSDFRVVKVKDCIAVPKVQETFAVYAG